MSIFKKVKPGELSSNTKPQHTVLLVDDEPDNLNVLHAILNNKYNVLLANDGQEAIDLVKAMPDPGQLTLVISDQRMPRLTGVQLCEQLCTISPKTKRIIVTGYIDIDAITDSVNRASIYKFIIKPFDRHDFELTVQRAIESFEDQQKHDNHVRNLGRELEASTLKIRQLEDQLQQLRAQLQQADKG